MSTKRTYFSEATGWRLTKKGWILPNGTFQPISGWHYQWLLDNAASVKKKFKLDVGTVACAPDSPDYDTCLRQMALEKGFIRVNYEATNGCVTFEGQYRFLTDAAKAAILGVVRDNAADIYSIRVSLFDRKWAVTTKTVQVFDVDDVDKANRIPFISETASLLLFRE